MKPHFTALAAALAATLTALAAVPIEWTVTPYTIAPVTVYRLRGETLDFRCTCSGFGELPFAQGADIRLWYQTNGMGSVWWSLQATVSSNVISATFPPQANPGTDHLALFFGAPSNAYASAVLNLRPSPGFTPNALPPPDVISWTTELASVRELIDYSTSNAALVATIEATSPQAGNYEIVSNRAMSAIQNEQDPTVPAWAKSETPPQTMTTNVVHAIVTNIAWSIISIDTTDPDLSESLKVVKVEYGEWSQLLDIFVENHHDFSMQITNGAAYPSSVIYAGIVIDIGDGIEIGTAVIENRNALGLARLSDLPPLTNAIPDTAARAVYDVHDLMWDETESILYWHKIRQGHDEYIAVTNIDLTHPTNAVILKAWREANR